MDDNLENEIELGKQAAEAVIKHMRRRMRSETKWALSDGSGVWILSLSYKPRKSDGINDNVSSDSKD